MNNHIVAFNKHDLEGLIKDMSEDIQLHLLEEDIHLNGREEVQEKYRTDFDKDPDAKVGIRQLLVEQDKAVLVEQFIESTYDKKKDVRFVTVAKIKDDKISELWKIR